MARSPVTLRDVAHHAGVSRATASLVLRGTGRVSAETRRRVQRSMDELGYVYNRSAASLRNRHATTVGVVVTNLANPFFGELLKGLGSELGAAGYTSLLVDTGNDVAAQTRAVNDLREHHVAGMAIVPASGTEGSFIDMLDERGIKHVFMTRYVRDQSTNYVGADDILGGQLAAEHLVKHGYSSFAYLGGPPTVLSRWDRIKGAKRALGSAGFDPTILLDITAETNGQGGIAAATRLMQRGNLPQAILCHSDQVAFGVLRALKAARRHKDVHVIGYDNIATAALWEPPLTSVATHGMLLGQRAAQSLLRSMNNPDVNKHVEYLQPELVVRESCGEHST